MYFDDFVGTLRRRWYLILPGLLVTLAAAALSYRSAPLSYQAQSDVVLLPVPAAQAKLAPDAAANNPYLRVGLARPTVDVIARVMNSSVTRRSVATDFPGASYTIAAPATTSAAILTVVVTSRNADEAGRAAASLVARLQQTMAEMQQQAGHLTSVPTSTVIIPSVIDQTPATPMTGSRIRAAAVITALGAFLSFLFAFVVDSVVQRRRRGADALLLQQWSAAEGAVSGR